MSSSGVHTAHVHPGPQSQTHWEALTGEATVGAGAGTSGIAVVPLPSMLLSSTGPAAMAHCKTEQEDWLLAHLKYLLFIFNFFFWVSGGCGTPLPTPALWSRSLWSHLYQGWLFPSQKPCWNQSCPALSVSPALALKAAAFKESVRAYPGQTVYVTSSIFPVSRTPRPCDPDCRNDVPFPLKSTCLAGQGLRAAL